MASKTSTTLGRADAKRGAMPCPCLLTARDNKEEERRGDMNKAQHGRIEIERRRRGRRRGTSSGARTARVLLGSAVSSVCVNVSFWPCPANNSPAPHLVTLLSRGRKAVTYGWLKHVFTHLPFLSLIKNAPTHVGVPCIVPQDNRRGHCVCSAPLTFSGGPEDARRGGQGGRDCVYYYHRA